MRGLVIALGVGLAACSREGAAPKPSASTPFSQATPRRPPAIAIARKLDLHQASHGSPLVGHVDEAEVLAWREDGFLRVRDGDRELEGFASPLGRTRGAGVGLYATEDSPLVGPDGARIGTALRGAFLPLRRIEATRVEVTLESSPEVVAFAERASLGTAKVDAEPRATRGRATNHVRATLAAGRFRTTTACDETVTARDDGRIAVVREGIELVGALAGVSACPVRVITRDPRVGEPVVPAGYVRTGALHVTAFARARTFWHEAEGSCRSVSFKPDARSGTLEATVKLGASGFAPGWTATSRAELRGVKSLLTKPTLLEEVSLPTIFRDVRGIPGSPPGHGEGVALCGNPRWLVVAEDEEGVTLLADTREDVVAYRPEDATVWFTSSAACDRSVARRAEATARDPLAATRRPAGCL